MTLRQRYYITKINILEAIGRVAERGAAWCDKFIQDETPPKAIDLGDGPKPIKSRGFAHDMIAARVARQKGDNK